jgi:hypothetical protein
MDYLPYSFNPETNGVYFTENPNLVFFKFDTSQVLTKPTKQRLVNLLNFGAIVENSFCKNDEPTLLSFICLFFDISSAFYNLVKKNEKR